MKIKDGFILRKVVDNYIVVAVGNAVKQFNGVINLNETGAFLWKRLAEGAEEQDLIDALLNEYEVSEEIAKRDVNKFVSKLKQEDLIK